MRIMLLSLLVFALPCLAQESPTPAFDVASVKISGSDSRNSGPPFQVAHGSLTTHGFSLRSCLVLAYQMVPLRFRAQTGSTTSGWTSPPKPPDQPAKSKST